jgi:hypothetical protein
MRTEIVIGSSCRDRANHTKKKGSVFSDTALYILWGKQLSLCCFVHIIVVHHGARILALGADITVDEFDDRHRRCI